MVRLTAYVLAIALAAATPALAQEPGRVFVIHVEGAIGIATERQLDRAIEAAELAQGEALIMRLDTPGGLVSSTRNMIQSILASPVPIVVYVSPPGAHAASAGTFILYASHIAAMAPSTSLGAATPVGLGGPPGSPAEPAAPDEDRPREGATAEERKAINDAVALLRSLAQTRGRNIEFAESAVRDAATLTSEEALRENVIELVAATIPDLISQLDGMPVAVNGVERTLTTEGVIEEVLETDWRTRLLGAITNPNIAFILLLVGIYGIIIEVMNPGILVPGVVGSISIILALTALATLPVHLGALALLLLGLGLMVAEAFSPGIGILGGGGLVAFIGGAIFLFEGAEADIDFAIATPVIIGAAAATAAMIFGVMGAAMRARRIPRATGSDQMIGMQCTVLDWNGTHGNVRAHGEVWSARSSRPLEPGSTARIVNRDGLTLTVEPEHGEAP